MSAKLSNVLSKSPFSVESITETPDASIRNKFTFHTTVLCRYVKYLQEVENKSKTEVQAQLNPIMNRLVAKFSFGAKFTSTINTYINSRFHQSSFNVYDEMKKESGLDDKTFEAYMSELRESKLMDEFSTRFKMVIQ